jgi:hypothetical protein
MSKLIDHFVRALDGLSNLARLADLDWRACT